MRSSHKNYIMNLKKKNIKDGEFFDSIEHASGKLINRLSTDAPNIRAAIDQR